MHGVHFRAETSALHLACIIKRRGFYRRCERINIALYMYTNQIRLLITESSILQLSPSYLAKFTHGDDVTGMMKSLLMTRETYWTTC